MIPTPFAVILFAPFAVATGPAAPTPVERYVAIGNVCAWPNLTQLRDGTIVATISHG